MAETTRRVSACRVCSGLCGTSIEVDEHGHALRLHGIRDHPMSHGYICPKGAGVVEDMRSPDRILRPLRRRADGTFEEVSVEIALDEIADRLRAILQHRGPDAVACFNGTYHWFNVPLHEIVQNWLRAIGSPNHYTTSTIDQSCHGVTMARMGSWAAGRLRLADSDVALIVGSNPLVSLGAYGIVSADPLRNLKAAQARGSKLIVIDPRRTETAAIADCHVQPLPGYDAMLAAALVHIVLAEGWHDRTFCEAYVDGVEDLRRALAPFTPAAVAARADIEPEELIRVAAMFARDGSKGIAIGGTGVGMTRFSNVTDHLLETLNVLCGRYYRAGDTIPNPPVLSAAKVYRAEVVPPNRTWESGPVNGAGYGQLFGEFPSSVLADVILEEGPKQVRALFVNGGNPAVCLPDQQKAVEALRSLDLLVAIEPFMSATARLCDYILPPRLMYERTDLYCGLGPEAFFFDIPFTQYLPAVVNPPSGSELIDDWQAYWGIAKRLGLQIDFAGDALDMETQPTTEFLLELVTRSSRIPLSDYKDLPLGKLFDQDLPVVQPGRPENSARFQLAPADVIGEIEAVANWREEEIDFTHRLIVRRDRAILNSRRYGPRKSAPASIHMHQDDLAALGVQADGEVIVSSTRGALQVRAVPDDTLRRGVASMSHCRDLLPEAADGAGATSIFVQTEVRENINAMTVMTALPITIRPVAGQAADAAEAGLMVS